MRRAADPAPLYALSPPLIGPRPPVGLLLALVAAAAALALPLLQVLL